MVSDRTENEPEEWDPEEELYDPDSDGLTIPQVTTEEDDAAEPDDVPSGIDIPSVSTAETGETPSGIDVPSISTAETDVPDEVLKTFWALVLVLNAAVLAVSLGLLLLAFEGDSTRGGALIVTGLVLFGFAWYRYRRFRDGSDGTENGTDAGDGSDIDAETADSGVDDAAETTSGDVTQ